METHSTIKGQVVIPAALRRKYGIKKGTKIIVTDIGDAIVLKPLTEQYLKSLQGSLKGKGGLKVLMDERQKRHGKRTMNMATKVLDSYALMVFFENEPGADLVRRLILDAVESDASLLMCVVNSGEIWYSIARTNSPEIADRYLQEIRGMGIEIVDADRTLTRQAAAFKAGGNISYADCFAAALAKIRKAELVTGDKEFKSLEGEIKISWI